MAKNRLFKNTTKISEMKDITGFLCIALAVAVGFGTVSGIKDWKQEKMISKLEADSRPIDEQVSEYKTQMKQYFASYLASDDLKDDFIRETNISERMYDALDASGVATVLTEEQISDLVDRAMDEMDYQTMIESVTSQEYRQLYNSIYRSVQQQVLDNISRNGMLVVEQEITYDTDSIKRQVLARLQASSSSKTPVKKIDQAAIDKAWAETIVENMLNKLSVPESKRSKIVTEASDQIAQFLKTEEGLELYKDGKDGLDGKDGKEVQKGIDYYTDEEISDVTERIIDVSYPVLTETLIQMGRDDPDSIIINAMNGYSVTGVRMQKNVIESSSKATTYNLVSTWARGSGSDIQTADDTAITLDGMKSIAGIVYEDTLPRENSQTGIESYANANLKIYYFVDDGNGNMVKSSSYDTIKVDSLANAFSKVYMDELFNDLYNGTVSVPDTSQTTVESILDNGKYVYRCTDHDKEITFNKDTGKWTCPGSGTAHEIISMDFSISDIRNQITGVTDSIGGLFENAMQWTEHDIPKDSEGHVTNSTSDTSARAAEEMLARYELLLEYMDKPFTKESIYTGIDGSTENRTSEVSLFDIYQENMKDQGGPGTYGIRTVHGEDADIILGDEYYAPDTNILKAYLIKKGYIREADGKLFFCGTDTDEKLYNASLSCIVEYMEYLCRTMYASGSNTDIAFQTEKVTDIFNHYIGAVAVLRDGVIRTSITKDVIDNCIPSSGQYIITVACSDADIVNLNYLYSLNGPSDIRDRVLTMKKVLGDISSDTLDYNAVLGAVLKPVITDGKVSSATVEIHMDQISVQDNDSLNLSVMWQF